MDFRKQDERRPVPSKQSDRDKAAALGAWMDAALAIYASKGGLMGVYVRRSPPPGEHPDLADDLQLHTEGAHDLRARIAE